MFLAAACSYCIDFGKKRDCFEQQTHPQKDHTVPTCFKQIWFKLDFSKNVQVIFKMKVPVKLNKLSGPLARQTHIWLVTSSQGHHHPVETKMNQHVFYFPNFFRVNKNKHISTRPLTA